MSVENSLQRHSPGSRTILYDDGKIKISTEGIELSWYWFPIGPSKFIPFDSIRSHRLRRHMTIFEMKSWGMGADFQVWWHLDFRKFNGDRNAIIIDVGGWPKIGFYPGGGNLDEVEKAYAIISARCHQD